MHRLAHVTLLPTLLALGTPTPARPGLDFPAPSFRNAEVRAEGVPGNLVDAFSDLTSRLAGPAWIGYLMPRVPRGPGRQARHDYDEEGRQGCGTYYLEGREGHDGPYHGAEEAGSFLVLFRVEQSEVRKIRALSTDCDIDAGGLAVYGFSSVDPGQSLDLLVSVTDGKRSQRLGDQSLFAIALHDDPAADDILERAATGDLDWGHENQAVFWLGSARGRRGFEALRRLAQNEDDADLRHHVAFGFYVSKAPESVDALIDMARHDASRKVRRQALFWLGQEASQRAVDELERVTDEDPDVEIKTYAVFALSQLPPDRGVPLLIRQARSHPHPAVRKKAIFWLGQSDDDRALEFFEEILLH